MRALRVGAGTSLRQAEAASGRSRGSLSQIETAKARPGRELVEWYDEVFSGDGLLLSIYTQAREAHGPLGVAQPKDEQRIDGQLLASGQLARRGDRLVAGWDVTNIGTVPWRGRVLRRIGAHAGPRLITSPASVPMADCLPGQCVRITVDLVLPYATGSFAAYWQVVDGTGRPCFAQPTPFAALVVAHE